MKQLKIEVTRASNGYVRREGQLTKNPDRFVRIIEKNGGEVETHKSSGDMLATLKGKTIGYFFGGVTTGYVFESARDFANFLKKAESGEFETSKRSPNKNASDSDTPTSRRKAATSDSDLVSKRRARRKPEEDAPVKGRGRKAAAVSEDSDGEEPEIDLDEYVDENAGDAANALEVLKLLKKEMKRVGVKSENVNGLVDVVNDYVKAAAKAESKRK